MISRLAHYNKAQANEQEEEKGDNGLENTVRESVEDLPVGNEDVELEEA